MDHVVYVSSSQLWPVCTRGDTGKCLETFLVVKIEGYVHVLYWPLCGEAKDASKHSTMHRTAFLSPQRFIWFHMSVVLRLGKIKYIGSAGEWRTKGRLQF